MSGRPTPVSVVPLFRSRTQVLVLAQLLLVDTQRTLTELARAAGVSVTAVQVEVDRLEAAGMVSSSRRGRSRLVSASLTGPLRSAVETLVLYAAGPTVVVAQCLSAVSGVDAAYLYGSWARRYLREPGPPPRDIDVLVVGSPDRDDVYEAAEQAERRLAVGLPVNATVVGAAAWSAADSPFLRQVRSAPLVPLALDRVA